jgi:hypothetical protein
LQSTSVKFIIDAVTAAGSAMVTFVEAEQPFASRMVMVYVPALSPEAFTAVPPVGVHVYEYGPVPPAAFAVAVPSAPPLQVTSVEVGIVAVGPAVFDTAAFAVAVHPFASVMVTT